MTREEAIYCLQIAADTVVIPELIESLNLGIDALREVQKIEDMKPLVIDAKTAAELRQMMQEVKDLKSTIETVDSDDVHCRECTYYRSDPLRDDIGFCVARLNINTTKPDGLCNLGAKEERGDER